MQRKSEKLGISADAFEAKFNELVSLEDEVSTRRGEKNKLEAQVAALTERQEKLSARMEKASSDFERDIKLIRQTRDELMKIAEMKGKYEKAVEDMEWAEQIIPFLRYPDKVDDPDFRLASAVVGCIDKWLPMQNLGFPWQVKWGEITRHAVWNGFGLGVAGALATEMEMTSGHMMEGMLVAFIMMKSMPATVYI